MANPWEETYEEAAPAAQVKPWEEIQGKPWESSFEEPEDTGEDDTFLENVGDVAAEFARGGNRMAADSLDFVTSPARYAWNKWSEALGTDSRMPSFNQLFDKLPGSTQKFMEEGMAQDAVSAAGGTAVLGLGFVPVQRAGGQTSAIVQDILGIGSTETSAAARMADITESAVKKMDRMQLGEDVLDTPDKIFNAAYSLGKAQVLENNRPLLDKAEELTEAAAKDAARNGATDIEIPKGTTQVSLRKIQDQMYSMYGVEPNDTLKAIRKNGGLNYDDDILRMSEADKIFRDAGTGSEKAVNWYDRTFLPISDTLRNYVSSGVGARFERAFETSTRNSSRIVESLGKPIQAVIRQADRDIELKRLLLDVGRDPDLMPRIQQRISSVSGESALREFNKFMAMSGNRNAEAMKSLYRLDAGVSDVYFLHTQKKPKPGLLKPGLGTKSYQALKGERPEALKVRTRGEAAKMDVQEVAMYENPLATHLQFLSEQETLLELSKKFGLRPSLEKNGNVLDVFKSIEKRLANDGFDDKIAEDAADLMFQTYMGSKKAPPPAVRAFMSQAYAGTLAQLKTSLLNIHDVAVSSFNQGFRPTMKALIQSNKGQFGKTLTELGIGDQQAVGEFVTNFDKFQSNPTAMDKLARQSKNVSDVAMFVSGFKTMDRVGKGVVLRAALNKARESASKGKLFENYEHLMSNDELRKIRPYLKDNTSAKDIPEDVSKLIEELAFTALGEQQLISVAGRPLNYLKYETTRPLYALTGFAIKQQALLRRKVIQEWAKGNYAKGGIALASYAANAGLGYGIIHEGREAISGKENFEPGDIWINAADQIAAAATLNKLGDDYGRSAFVQDPAGFLMESFVPPTGLVGAAGEDVADVIFKGEYNAKLFERVPMLGDFYKYYWKDK